MLFSPHFCTGTLLRIDTVHEQHNSKIEGPVGSEREHFDFSSQPTQLCVTLVSAESFQRAKLAQLRSLKAYRDDDDAISKIVMITESSKEELIK